MLNKKWIEYNHENKKVDLTDCTFLIPVHYDHEDRRKNLYRILLYLTSNFNTNIIVGEQGSKEFKDLSFDYTYLAFDEMDTFHRTKIINDMCKLSNTPIIINYDTDVIVPVIQLLQAVKLMRLGQECVFPYDGRFARIPKPLQGEELENLDITKLLGARSFDPVSVGGCVGYRKDAFYDVGMENEHFISYGPEDTERVERAEKLGLEIKRIKGPLYHYDHFVGINSSGKNPHFGANYDELGRIRNMNKEQLQGYIDSWSWCKQTVTI